MGAFLRKYNTLLVTGTTAIRVPIIKRGVVDFAASGDWTPAAGDVKVWVDGAAASITNLPTAINSGNCTFWEFILTAAELSAKQIIVVVTDSATKAVEDQAFVVETYGHASAMYAADLSAANLPANVTQLLGTAWLAPGTAGTPDVNAKLIGATAQTGLDFAANWTAARAAHLDADISSRMATYIQPTGFLAANFGLLANLDAAISSLNNLSALCNIYGSPLLEIPDSSTTTFAFTVVTRDNEGKLKDLDASPTIAAANAAGTDRSSNLSAVSHPSTGRYTFTYGVTSAAAEESLRITVTGAISSEARYIEWIGAVVNYDSITTLAAIKAKTDQLTFTTTNKVDATVPITQKVDVNTIKTNPVVSLGTTTFQNGTLADTDDTELIFADVESLLDMTDGGGAFLSGAFANIPKTGYALTSAYDLAKTAAQAGNAMTVSDKTGFKLASDGLDSIAITAPTGPAANFRQMVVQTWRRFFKKATLTATLAKTYADDGTTVITTQTVSNDGTTQTQGNAS